MKNQAFTLIEILVVVLIIGILAAIALPQYQIAVGKTRFSNTKNMAKALAEAEEIFYLANGHYTSDVADLDVVKPDNISCNLWSCQGCQKCVACYTSVSNVTMAYYQFFLHDDPNGFEGKRDCLVYSTDQNDIPNKICQQETGNDGKCSKDGYCDYFYD